MILQIIFYLRFKVAFRPLPELARLNKFSKSVINTYPPICTCVFIYYVYYESNLYGHSFHNTQCNVPGTQHLKAFFPSAVAVVFYDIFLVGLFISKLFKVVHQIGTTNTYKVK